MKSRLLSAVLCVCMMTMLLPTAAFALEDGDSDASVTPVSEALPAVTVEDAAAPAGIPSYEQGSEIDNDSANDDLASALATTLPVAGFQPIGDTDSTVGVTLGDLGIATALCIVDGASAPQYLRDGQLTLAWATAPGETPAKLRMENCNLVSVGADGTTSALTTGQAAAVAQGVPTVDVADSNGNVYSVPVAVDLLAREFGLNR